jgi:hypothetical protein
VPILRSLSGPLIVEKLSGAALAAAYARQRHIQAGVARSTESQEASPRESQLSPERTWRRYSLNRFFNSRMPTVLVEFNVVS